MCWCKPIKQPRITYWTIQPYHTEPYNHILVNHTTISYWTLQPFPTEPYNHILLNPLTKYYWTLQPHPTEPCNHILLNHTTISYWTMQPNPTEPFNHILLHPATISYWTIQYTCTIHLLPPGSRRYTSYNQGFTVKRKVPKHFCHLQKKIEEAIFMTVWIPRECVFMWLVDCFIAALSVVK